jgi:hypothetical protein
MPTCVIIKSGRFDEFGRNLLSGSTYTGSLDQCRALVDSGFARHVDLSVLEDGSTGGFAQPFGALPLTPPAARQVSLGGAGSSVLGPFTDLTALQLAKPAAVNIGFTAYVGVSAPFVLYRSDGTVWSIGAAGTTNLTNTPSAADVLISSSSGTSTALPAATGALAGVFLPSEKTKLAGVQSGATANAADAALIARANHTGT